MNKQAAPAIRTSISLTPEQFQAICAKIGPRGFNQYIRQLIDRDLQVTTQQEQED